MVQLSHPYMTTGKTIALTTWTFISKVMSLLFWYTVWVCHSFLSKEQVSFNFMAAVTICSDFGAQENKVPHCFHCSPIYLPWGDGTRCHDLRFFDFEFQANFFTLLFHSYQEALKTLKSLQYSFSLSLRTRSTDILSLSLRAEED